MQPFGCFYDATTIHNMQLKSCVFSDRDDDFASGMSFFQIPDGVWDLTQGVVSVDNRRDLPGFKKFFQDVEVLAALFRHERDKVLTHEG